MGSYISGPVFQGKWLFNNKETLKVAEKWLLLRSTDCSIRVYQSYSDVHFPHFLQIFITKI